MFVITLSDIFDLIGMGIVAVGIILVVWATRPNKKQDKNKDGDNK